MPLNDCDAECRNKRALYEIELAWGSGVIDLRRIKAILTAPEEHDHEENRKDGHLDAMAEAGGRGSDAPDCALGLGDGRG